MPRTDDLDIHHQILIKMLESQAEQKTAEWFTNYLKGEIEYRGLKTGMLKSILSEFFQKTELDQQEDEIQLPHIRYWLSQPMAEDKLTAILWLQKWVKNKLKKNTQDSDISQALSLIEFAFQNGHIHDWSTNDWLCVRVLELIPEKAPEYVSRIEAWAQASTIWQKRSAILSFKKSVKQGKYHPLIEDMIKKLLETHHAEERFVQTGIGWVLADASRNYGQWAESLFEKHFDSLSKEVIIRHTKHLSNHEDFKKRAKRK